MKWNLQYILWGKCENEIQVFFKGIDINIFGTVIGEFIRRNQYLYFYFFKFPLKSNIIKYPVNILKKYTIFIKLRLIPRIFDIHKNPTHTYAAREIKSTPPLPLIHTFLIDGARVDVLSFTWMLSLTCHQYLRNMSFLYISKGMLLLAVPYGEMYEDGRCVT